MKTKTYYINLMFAQEHDAAEYMEYLDENGELATVQYLADLFDNSDAGGSGSETNPAGDNDHTYIYGAYQLNYNTGLPYIGLTKILKITILEEQNGN